MFRRRNSYKSEIRSANLLPMIDVLFVVMAFLILAANFTDSPEAMSIDLPSSRSASKFNSKNKTSDIRLSKEGFVYIADESFELDSFLTEAHSGLSQTVRLFADKQVDFNSFVRVYDHLASRLSREVFLMIEKVD